MKRLLHISDCHLFADTSSVGYGGVAPYASLQLVLAHAFSTFAGDIDLVLVTGDISGDDSLLSYQHFKTVIATCANTPVYVIGGNHDNNAHFASQLGPFLLHAGASIDLGEAEFGVNEKIPTNNDAVDIVAQEHPRSWCIHALDTRYQGTRGKIDDEQLALVKQDVENSQNRFHLLAMHHHIVPSGSWMDTHDIVNPEILTAWATSTPNLKGIIHGHVHAPLRNTLQNVTEGDTPVIGGPSSCWQWEMSKDFAVSQQLPGYQIVSLHKDGTISCDVRRIHAL